MSTGEARQQVESQDVLTTTPFHRLPWTHFDELARGEVRADVVRHLRRVERSRRLLLSRALLDEVTKTPELFGQLPSPEDAWNLLARVEATAPTAFDHVLAHPYFGSWAGYTIRLLRNGITGVCPLWMHVGHLHSIAAAAAIHAGLRFHISVPVWEGGAILPTLGLARFPVIEPHSVAEVRSDGRRIEVRHGSSRVVLPDRLDADTPDWWSIRRVTASAGRRRLTVRLDDLDPYRGLREPVRPRRLDAAEVGSWDDLIGEAWRLLDRDLPDLADTFSAGLDSLVPMPAVVFRSASASTGEAFGSALVARPVDGAELAATLVHELQHIVLGGVLHVVGLYEDDPSERFYVPWRPDPRPLSGALQGVYAFFGIAAFWRAMARAETGNLSRRASFEFALSRSHAWLVLEALRDDPALTSAGRRFVDGIASRLGPWQDEHVPDELCRLADAVTTDHRAGFRIRHVRPDNQAVTALAEAWMATRPRPPVHPPSVHPVPTPVQDGEPSSARADLIRLGITSGDRRVPALLWQSVPGATVADLAYATGRFHDAVHGYRAELANDSDRVSSWVGLGLALAALGTNPAARALTSCPELVRAVRRRISTRAPDVPTPERLAAWIGQVMA
ncbi:HEXXH motif domain-containing protein [Actinophytocola sp.]|uniref:HEXXH motif domain-containing protein n=1 Tax=Actinophytocola sp. TaxID=1872138 RepID=UPI003899F618